MIIAGVLFDELAGSVLKKSGVKDSKLLLPETREKLSKNIKRLSIAYEIVKISPQEIDDAVISGFNINKLEALRMGQIINHLVSGLGKDAKVTVYVDCPSNNIPAWKSVLLTHIPNKENLDFRVEHKCDVNHVECSAASVLAKVTRDDEVRKIKRHFKIDCGSGYPSDPVCVAFLKTKDAARLVEKGVIRKSWETFRNLKKDVEQKKLF